MEERILTADIIDNFKKNLELQEKSMATIEKYIRDVKAFSVYAQDEVITKEIVIAYKNYLQKNYAVRSVNSMLASINSLFAFLNWYDLRVKLLKLQQQVFCSEEKELTRFGRILLNFCKDCKERIIDQIYEIRLIELIARHHETLSSSLKKMTFFCFQ